jgi:uncharacterized RmlC-like cupin family protein
MPIFQSAGLPLRGCLLVCLGSAGLLAASDRPPFIFWSASQIQQLDQKMLSELDAAGGAREDLVKENGYVRLVYRTGSVAQGERHDEFGDLGIVRAGQGYILTGNGTLKNETTSSPGEFHGKIEGGAKHPISAGDVYYVPAGIPHQILLDSGKSVSIAMVKVHQKPGVPDRKEYISWSAVSLAEAEKKLPAQMDRLKNADDKILFSKSYVVILNYKEGTNLSEIHKHMAEVQFVREGGGFIMLGGELEGMVSHDAEEVRGSSLKGAVKRPLLPGDILYFPANTPHQTHVESDHFTKFVVKFYVND